MNNVAESSGSQKAGELRRAGARPSRRATKGRRRPPCGGYGRRAHRDPAAARSGRPPEFGRARVRRRARFRYGLRPQLEVLIDGEWRTLTVGKLGADNVFRDPQGEIVARTLLDANSRLTLLNDKVARYDFGGGPYPEMGSGFGVGHAGPPPYDFRKSSYADTSCIIGSHLNPTSKNASHIFMPLSELRPSTGRPWRASELRPLMKFARDVWSPAEMCAKFSLYTRDLPKIADPSWAAGVPTLKPWIGWITYLPADLAARAKYPEDTQVETLDDGAALVTLCEEPFDKTDAPGRARLKVLEAALRPIQT